MGGGVPRWRERTDNERLGDKVSEREAKFRKGRDPRIVK